MPKKPSPNFAPKKGELTTGLQGGDRARISPPLPIPLPTYRRRRVRRQIRPFAAEANAHATLGTIEPGCDILCLTKGQFSIANLIVATLAQTGPAHVTISTWTAAQAQIDEAHRLLQDGNIITLQWLVDYSFPSRQPAYCQRLRERFGDACIRVTRNHAKFVIIRNGTWNIVIRTSMNLNNNPRFEQWELSDDPAMADYFESVVQDVFKATDPQQTFDLRPQDHCDEFDAFGMNPDAADCPAHFGVSLDDPTKPGLTIGAKS